MWPTLLVVPKGMYLRIFKRKAEAMETADHNRESPLRTQGSAGLAVTSLAVAAAAASFFSSSFFSSSSPYSFFSFAGGQVYYRDKKSLRGLTQPGDGVCSCHC